MIKLPWKHVTRPLEPRQMVNPRLMGLETAKQILEEIFQARPSDFEEMIQMGLEEKWGIVLKMLISVFYFDVRYGVVQAVQSKNPLALWYIRS